MESNYLLRGDLVNHHARLVFRKVPGVLAYNVSYLVDLDPPSDFDVSYSM